MKFTGLILGFFLGLGFLTAPLWAMAQGRVVHQKPLIQVVTDPVQVLYFHDYTTAQIEEMRHMKLHNRLLHCPGVTLAEHEYKMDYQIGGLRHSNRRGILVWIESINVHFSYAQMHVYISSQYPVGSCPYRVILNHENQHVSIDQRVLAKYRRMIENALKHSRVIPTRSRPLKVNSMSGGKEITNQRLERIVNPILAAYKKEIIRENGKIDTPANYRRTQALCNDW